MNDCLTESGGKLNRSTTLGNADQVVVRILTETLQSGQSLEFNAKVFMANSAVPFRLRTPVKFSLAAAAGED
jgi:hypothetical protein